MPNRSKLFSEPGGTVCMGLQFRQLIDDLYDIVLLVGDGQVGAHKVILSEQSKYFNKLLNASPLKKNEDGYDMLELSNAFKNKNILVIFLNYIYGGEITIRNSEVEDILNSAKILNIEGIDHACNIFMLRSLCPKNCLEFLKIAKDHGLHDLRSVCLDLIQVRFKDYFASCMELLDLSPLLMKTIVFDKGMKLLKPAKQRQVMYRWFNHKPDERYAHCIDMVLRIEDDKCEDKILNDIKTKIKTNECSKEVLAKLLKTVVEKEVFPMKQFDKGVSFGKENFWIYFPNQDGWYSFNTSAYDKDALSKCGRPIFLIEDTIVFRNSQNFFLTKYNDYKITDAVQIVLPEDNHCFGTLSDEFCIISARNESDIILTIADINSMTWHTLEFRYLFKWSSRYETNSEEQPYQTGWNSRKGFSSKGKSSGRDGSRAPLNHQTNATTESINTFISVQTFKDKILIFGLRNKEIRIARLTKQGNIYELKDDGGSIAYNHRMQKTSDIRVIRIWQDRLVVTGRCVYNVFDLKSKTWVKSITKNPNNLGPSSPYVHIKGKPDYGKVKDTTLILDIDEDMLPHGTNSQQLDRACLAYSTKDTAIPSRQWLSIGSTKDTWYLNWSEVTPVPPGVDYEPSSTFVYVHNTGLKHLKQYVQMTEEKINDCPYNLAINEVQYSSYKGPLNEGASPVKFFKINFSFCDCLDTDDSLDEYLNDPSNFCGYDSDDVYDDKYDKFCYFDYSFGEDDVYANMIQSKFGL